MQTYRPKVNCPYCGSIQVKRMPAQPNKYPRPIDPSLLSDWQNGYDCKKCGSEFVIAEVMPRKNGGCLKTILSTVIFMLAIYGAYHFLFSEKTTQNTKQEESEPAETNQANIASQPLAPLSPDTVPQNPPVIADQQFSSEAEQSAHVYTPTAEDYKRVEQQKQQSIANSSDPSETLHISTTIRHKN